MDWLNRDVYLFYKSGILRSEIVINKNEFLIRTLNIFDNLWSDYVEIKSRDIAIKHLPERIFDVYNEVKAINLKNVETFKTKKFCLEKYKKIDENTWLWVMQTRNIPVDLIVKNNEIIGYILTIRDECSVLIKKGNEDLTPLELWNDEKISKDKYCIKHLGTFYINTVDDADLATDVWIPKSDDINKKFPVVFKRTPYGRLDKAERWFKYVCRGYALVIQDVRGREDSTGEWVPYKYDRQDGDESLNWISKQYWCDGNIGMIGSSYLGCVQWHAAASGNKNLKAIVSMVTSGPPFIDIERKGGIIPSGSFAWTFMMADKKMNRKALKRNDWDTLLNHRPIKEIPRVGLGRSIHFCDEQMKHLNNDEFWKNTDWSLYGDKIDVPSLIISGWYDDNGMGSTVAWEMNEKNKRNNQKLVFGPWKHGFNSSREIHGVKFGNNSIRYDIDVLTLKWFDKFLKGIDNDIENQKSVQYYLVGENKWMEDNKWPPENVEYTNIYLNSDGNAQTSSGNGSLSWNISKTDLYDTYDYDPHNPVPFLIDVSENEMNVPANYKDIDKRYDVLVYTSEVLKEPVTIAGNIYAVLYAASSAKDTDWVVRLEDVDENENSIRLTDGILRARYRNSFENPTLLEPEKIEEYNIRMAKTANVFKKGHRIRVTITSSAKALVFPNHNTGNNPYEDVEMIKAVQKIYHGSSYHSHVKLPIIKL
ncbi:CocE/NonD family hydrolase [Abyssisolibacter fermentans]|uniref:CocE/NonD family hydrolase n=1 Tax=Abyssisolibacter fermentans TaxID=1766203 RepID=UPI00082B7A6C|nr:CocE/NonD family hydrolase [Abyssisolibacter fermentans]